MNGFGIIGLFIGGFMVLGLKLVRIFVAGRKRAWQRQKIEHESVERQLSYARHHIENVTARNRRSMLGVRVIARSNNDEPLLIGRITGFMEITKANNPVPAVVEESTGKIWHPLGLVVPYNDELMAKLESMSFKEQWEFMVAEGLGMRWE